MKKIKITAIRKANYNDLQEKYELFQEILVVLMKTTLG